MVLRLGFLAVIDASVALTKNGIAASLFGITLVNNWVAKSHTYGGSLFLILDLKAVSVLLSLEDPSNGMPFLSFCRLGSYISRVGLSTLVSFIIVLV